MTRTPPRRERPRLLLVEDHKDMRGVLSRLFALAGWDVAECRDLAEAYACLATHYGAYDAAVIDLWLPDGHGDEFIADVARIRAARRIIAYTASERTNAVVDRCFAAGADAVAFKPISFGQVILPLVLGTFPLPGVEVEPGSVRFPPAK